MTWRTDPWKRRTARREEVQDSESQSPPSPSFPFFLFMDLIIGNYGFTGNELMTTVNKDHHGQHMDSCMEEWGGWYSRGRGLVVPTSVDTLSGILWVSFFRKISTHVLITLAVCLAGALACVVQRYLGREALETDCDGNLWSLFYGTASVSMDPQVSTKKHSNYIRGISNF